MVLHIALSLDAFCSSNTTLSSPSFSIRASLKPCVAASRASCLTSWHMPTVYLSFLPEQDVSDTHDVTVSAAVSMAARIECFFFILVSSDFKIFFGLTE